MPMPMPISDEYCFFCMLVIDFHCPTSTRTLEFAKKERRNDAIISCATATVAKLPIMENVSI